MKEYLMMDGDGDQLWRLSITAINVYRVINHDIDRSHTLRHLIDARSFITTLIRPFQQALLNSSRQRSSGPLLLWFSLAAPDGFRACIGFWRLSLTTHALLVFRLGRAENVVRATSSFVRYCNS
jgi:hypothetical protein